LILSPLVPVNPSKPATIAGWEQTLNAWLLPNIGEKPLADVTNKVLRELVGKMTAAKLSAKTIVSYTQVVKLVVASAVNENGDQIHPRVWNNDFAGVPIVDKTKQRRQTITQTELEDILTSVKDRYRVLFALLAGTGLRIGEAIGLKTTDFGPDCRVLHVNRSVWGGRAGSKNIKCNSRHRPSSTSSLDGPRIHRQQTGLSLRDGEREAATAAKRSTSLARNW
jgi:integrase